MVLQGGPEIRKELRSFGRSELKSIYAAAAIVAQVKDKCRMLACFIEYGVTNSGFD
jgi:hypothetical protein